MEEKQEEEIQQKGGFYLSDNRESKKFRNIIKTRLKRLELPKKNDDMPTKNLFEIPNYRKLTRPGGLTQNDENIFDILLEKLQSIDHKKLYSFFIKQIFDKETYIQRFTKKKGTKPFLKSKPIYPYVKNFMALICVSFILELELYSLTHLVITPNFFDNKRMEGDKVVYGNKLRSVIYSEKRKEEWRTLTNEFRIYRNFLSEFNLQKEPPSIDQIIEEFTKRIDVLFTKFMNLFISNLSISTRSTFDEIKKLIVPVNHYDHGPRRNPSSQEARLNNVRVDDYDHIFVDWKKQLMNQFDNKITKKDINIIFQNTLNEFENNKTKYIAEGTGFFSFVFLKFMDPEFKKYPSLYKEQVHNGSCITYSLMESYFMTKLHFNTSHINLLLVTDSNFPVNNVWEYCKQSLDHVGLSHRKLNFSHWATRLRFKTTDKIDFRLDMPYHDVAYEINFLKQRDEFIKLLLFPILDSYKNYLSMTMLPITINIDDYSGKTLEKDIPSDIKLFYFKKIHDFIESRYNMITLLLKKRNYGYLERDMLSGIQRKKYVRTKKKKKVHKKKIAKKKSKRKAKN